MEPAIRAPGTVPDRLCTAQPAGRDERERASQSDYPSLQLGSGERLRQNKNAADRGKPVELKFSSAPLHQSELMEPAVGFEPTTA